MNNNNITADIEKTANTHTHVHAHIYVCYQCHFIVPLESFNAQTRLPGPCLLMYDGKVLALRGSSQARGSCKPCKAVPGRALRSAGSPAHSGVNAPGSARRRVRRAPNAALGILQHIDKGRSWRVGPFSSVRSSPARKGTKQPFHHPNGTVRLLTVVAIKIRF